MNNYDVIRKWLGLPYIGGETRHGRKLGRATKVCIYGNTIFWHNTPLACLTPSGGYRMVDNSRHQTTQERHWAQEVKLYIAVHKATKEVA